MRLTTRKSVNPTTISPSSSSISATSTASATALEIVKAIASLEGKYQNDLNHGFAKLSEGEFKALRRQLPVTRQKVEWEKVGGYRVSTTVPGFVTSLVPRPSFFVPLLSFFFFFFCHGREKLNGQHKRKPAQTTHNRTCKGQILTQLSNPQLGQDIGGGRLR